MATIWHVESTGGILGWGVGSGLLRWYNNKRAEKEEVAGFGVVVRLAAFGSVGWIWGGGWIWVVDLFR